MSDNQRGISKREKTKEESRAKKLVNVDDGLEDIRWIRGLGSEKLPAASYALLPNLKKALVFAIREGSKFSVACILHTRGQPFLHQTPGRRPPRITGRVVNTVARGWVGAPNERAPFIFHDALVGFVDRYLSDSESRRFQLNIWLSFSQADLGPTFAQILFFSGYF